MSDVVDAASARDWRDVCGRIGWVAFAMAATIVVMTVIEFFVLAVTPSGWVMSVDQVAGIMLRIRITLGVVAAIVVMAVIATRWALLTASLLALGVLIVLASTQITSAG